jgi:hypothetical protein
MERGLAYILRAERELRKNAEGHIRQLKEVLMELAYGLAWEKLEETRKRDLQAPDNWSPDDWRDFPARNAKEGSGWCEPDALRSDGPSSHACWWTRKARRGFTLPPARVDRRTSCPSP